MSAAVIDTSVVMCVLLKERGRERALDAAQNALISSVNVAEAVGKCIERGIAEKLALLFLQERNVTVMDFAVDDAVLAGRLWARAPKGALSLGDRACLATAIRADATAVTADRVWTTLDLPCPVELIR